MIRIVGDVLFVNLAFLISFYTRFLGNVPTKNLVAFVQLIPYITLFSVIIMELYNLYSRPLTKNLTEILYSLIPVSFFIVLFSVAISYFTKTYAFPRSVFLISPPVVLVTMIFWRYLVIILEYKLIKPCEIIIVGKAKEARKLTEIIKHNTNGGYKLKGVILQEIDELSEKYFTEKGVEFTAKFDSLERYIQELQPELIFITNGLTEEKKKQLLYLSLDKNQEIVMVPDFYEIMLSGGRIELIGELPVFEIKPINLNRNTIVRRLIDIFLSLTGLIITLPISILATVLIKLDSAGPIFYAQQRITRQGKVFNIYKFRTMVNNAEEKTGPVLTSNNDQRITRIGKLLRKTHLDEIPQLYNILRGDMSLVGPRPERPCFVEEFEKEIPEYKYRHQVKSGLTGLAQISGFYNTSPEDKLRLDLLYANKTSILFDFKIILHTLKAIFMTHKAS